MKLNFCTLFNSAYLSRGLALYESLRENTADFHLYVFAFDDKAEQLLRKMALPSMTVVNMTEFEDAELLRVKKERSPMEYCWTCTPSVILYSIRNFGLDHCSYLDADLFFYSDPRVLMDELNGGNIMLTEHDYTPSYDQSADSGKFCIQYLTFRNTAEGMKALNWWRDRCIEWCYARVEDGKFGDQKYLDDWESRFEGVVVSSNQGAGVAPWNIQKFEVEMKNDKPVLTRNNRIVPIVFFHFHGVKFYQDEIVSLAGAPYDISGAMKKAFYFPYIKRLLCIGSGLRESGVAFDTEGISGTSPHCPWNFRFALIVYLAELKLTAWNILGRTMSSRRRHHHYHYIRQIH